MQSEDGRIHVFIPKLKSLFYQIERHFLKKSYLDSNPVWLLNIGADENHLTLNEIYCGVNVDIALSNNNFQEDEILIFKNCAKQFYIQFCNTLTKKVNFNDKILCWATKFSPESVLSGETNSIVPLIMELFPTCETDIIEQKIILSFEP